MRKKKKNETLARVYAQDKAENQNSRQNESGKKNIFASLGEKILKFPIWVWIVFAVSSGFLSIYFAVSSGGECFLKRTVGIACPSCGMTRAYFSLFRLDFKAALYYHPLFWDVPVIVVCGILASVTKNSKRRKIYLWLFAASILALLVCWIVRLSAGTAV